MADPSVIFLQPFDGEQRTWCEDRQDDEDVEYMRRDLAGKGEAERYWEARYRDEKADNERMRGALLDIDECAIEDMQCNGDTARKQRAITIRALCIAGMSGLGNASPERQTQEVECPGCKWKTHTKEFQPCVDCGDDKSEFSPITSVKGSDDE